MDTAETQICGFNDETFFFSHENLPTKSFKQFYTAFARLQFPQRFELPSFTFIEVMGGSSKGYIISASTVCTYKGPYLPCHLLFVRAHFLPRQLYIEQSRQWRSELPTTSSWNDLVNYSCSRIIIWLIYFDSVRNFRDFLLFVSKLSMIIGFQAMFEWLLFSRVKMHLRTYEVS